MCRKKHSFLSFCLALLMCLPLCAQKQVSMRSLNSIERGEMLKEPVHKTQRRANSLEEVVNAQLMVDGVNYAIINDEYAEVTGLLGKNWISSNNYTGDVNVVDVITYQGKQYPVESIDSYAFFGSDLTSLTLPQSIRYVGASAFVQLKLQELVLPDGIEEMGGNPFAASTIESLTLPKNLKKVPEDFLYNTQYLTTLKISDESETLKVVDNVLFSADGKTIYAYPGGLSAEEYTIPEGVERIAGYSFTNGNLRTITLSSTVNDACGWSFGGAYYLSELKVAENNSIFYGMDGMLIQKEGDALVCFPTDKAQEEYTLPEGIKAIQTYALSSVRIPKLHLPKSLETIQDKGFWYSSIDTIVVYTEVPAKAQPSAFYELSGKRILVVPTGCIDAYKQAEGWSSFKGIYDQRTIAFKVFEYNNLRYQRLSDEDDNLEVKCLGFVEEPVAKKALSITKSPVFDDVTYTTVEIGDFAFQYVRTISRVTIPTTVRRIGDGAFETSSVSGTTITAGSELEEIGERAFYDTELSSISLPASLKRIGKEAYMWAGVSGFTVTLPESLEYIGDDAFSSATVTSFRINGTSEYFKVVDGVVFNSDMTRLVCYPANKNIEEYTVPATVDTISTNFGYLLPLLIVQTSTPPVCTDRLGYVGGNTNVIVPAGAKEAYLNDVNWNSFKSIVEENEILSSVDDGIYYFYNEEAGTFMSRGADWFTRATTDFIGVPIYVTFEKSRMGYKLQYADDPTHYLGYDYDDPNPYTDKTESFPIYWTIQLDDEGKAKLYNIGEKLWFKAENPFQGCTFTHDVSEATTFTLIASPEEYAEIRGEEKEKEDFLAQIENLTPVDVTDAIKNPTMSSSVSGWTTNFYPLNRINIGSGLSETYEHAGYIQQNITGLEPGIYKFSIQGFQRASSPTTCAKMEDMGYKLGTAFIYANNYMAQMATWASDRYSATYPNTMAETRVTFDDGCYMNEVFAYVGESGSLTIGIECPSRSPENWIIWRNATLTYYEDQADAIESTISHNQPVQIYSPSGLRLDKPTKGLNIIRQSDGKVVKMFSK